MAHPDKHIREAIGAIMKTYGFTLTIKGHHVCSEEMADAIYAAGGDDSTVCSSGGVVTVAFDRRADSLDEAITSAVKTLAAAGYQVSHIEIDDETLQLLAS